MYNPITEQDQKDLDDLLRIENGVAACKNCGAQTKVLYMTDRGYLCRTHK